MVHNIYFVIDLITCQILLLMRDVLTGTRIELRDLICICLMLKEGYGRVAISRRLGFGERRIRGIVNVLKKSNCLDRVFRVLTSFQREAIRTTHLKCTPVLYSNLDENLLNNLAGMIVTLRDYIVVNSRDPTKIEVIGIVKAGMLIYPGLPDQFTGPYMKIAEFIQNRSGLLTCWTEYKEYLDDATLLASLIDICAQYSINRY